ncbi:hypothetical protein MLD52_04840 [Puniceicoccaceae bacterium K14]|nr:hypothetical protein [Puniceicoccaceae bacterium K14]
MPFAVDRYLSSLLAYTPARISQVRDVGDFICLIHVPASGSEKVFSLHANDGVVTYTQAAFKQSVSDYVMTGETAKPEVDVLRSQIRADHPAIAYLKEGVVKSCDDCSDGSAGLDYYLLIYQFKGELQTVECWEPFGRECSSWHHVISGFQTLGQQFERVSTSGSELSKFECSDSLL